MTCAQTEHLISFKISYKLFTFASASCGCVVERLRTAAAGEEPLVDSRCGSTTLLMQHESFTTSILHTSLSPPAHPRFSRSVSQPVRSWLLWPRWKGLRRTPPCGGCLTPFFMGRQRREDRLGCCEAGGVGAGIVLRLLLLLCASLFVSGTIETSSTLVHYGCILRVWMCGEHTYKSMHACLCLVNV